MGVQHGHGVARTDRTASAPADEDRDLKERVQHERRQREIVDPVDLAGDFDLLQVVAVNLDQDLDAQRTGLGGQFGDEFEGFGNHETAGARLLDCVPDRVEPDHLDPRSLELAEDRLQIGFRLRMPDIDVDLLRIEGGPQYFPLARQQRDGAERKRRARPIDAQNVRFACALREDPVEGEEHARIRRSRTLLGEVEELRGRR